MRLLRLLRVFSLLLSLSGVCDSKATGGIYIENHTEDWTCSVHVERIVYILDAQTGEVLATDDALYATAEFDIEPYEYMWFDGGTFCVPGDTQAVTYYITCTTQNQDDPDEIMANLTGAESNVFGNQIFNSELEFAHSNGLPIRFSVTRGGEELASGRALVVNNTDSTMTFMGSQIGSGQMMGFVSPSSTSFSPTVFGGQNLTGFEDCIQPIYIERQPHQWTELTWEEKMLWWMPKDSGEIWPTWYWTDTGFSYGGIGVDGGDNLVSNDPITGINWVIAGINVPTGNDGVTPLLPTTFTPMAPINPSEPPYSPPVYPWFPNNPPGGGDPNDPNDPDDPDDPWPGDPDPDDPDPGEPGDPVTITVNFPPFPTDYALESTQLENFAQLVSLNIHTIESNVRLTDIGSTLDDIEQDTDDLLGEQILTNEYLEGIGGVFDQEDDELVWGKLNIVLDKLREMFGDDVDGEQLQLDIDEEREGFFDDLMLHEEDFGELAGMGLLDRVLNNVPAENGEAHDIVLPGGIGVINLTPTSEPWVTLCAWIKGMLMIGICFWFSRSIWNSYKETALAVHQVNGQNSNGAAFAGFELNTAFALGNLSISYLALIVFTAVCGAAVAVFVATSAYEGAFAFAQAGLVADAPWFGVLSAWVLAVFPVTAFIGMMIARITCEIMINIAGQVAMASMRAALA